MAEITITRLKNVISEERCVRARNETKNTKVFLSLAGEGADYNLHDVILLLTEDDVRVLIESMLSAIDKDNCEIYGLNTEEVT